MPDTPQRTDGPAGWLDRAEARDGGSARGGGTARDGAVARSGGFQERHERCPEGAGRRHSAAGIGHPRSPDPRTPVPRTPELWPAASDFIRAHHAEERLGDAAPRLAEAYAEIAETGTYRHTERELTFGARVAWRNANRCIGRLYWNSLHVRDRRDLTAAEDIAAACADHLRGASQGGRIRP